MKLFAVKVPRNNEYTYEQSLALFSSLRTSFRSWNPLSLLSQNKSESFSFNIFSLNQSITFVLGASEGHEEHLKSQLLAQYGDVDIVDWEDPPLFEPVYAQLKTTQSSYLPIKTITQFQDVDPLGSILSTISRAPHPHSFFWMQIILTPPPFGWHQNVTNYINKLQDPEVTKRPNPLYISHMQEKIKFDGYTTYLRIISDSKENLKLFSNAFSIYAEAGGNKIGMKTGGVLTNKSLKKAILSHKPHGAPVLLNNLELATLWHLPTAQINIPNIAWGKKLILDAPENLPIAHDHIKEREKKELTFLGKTTFKNKDTIFGIKNDDRLRHIYIIGKTGSGKSTLIANMAIDDIRKGRGTAILDPHGDLIDIILNYIPKNRINDVCYLNPVDSDYAYSLNMLEVPNDQQKELMVSGIISIFYKLYSYSWGPRMEHILRNVLFTLATAEGATLVDVLRILNEKGYREKILKKVQDPYILRFWEDEYEGMTEKFKIEAIAPIMNKIGQFVSSPIIRKIIGWQKSKIKIPEIMDNKKILLVDLSQGKMGEDNSALLGAMIITQIQLAAMNRAFKAESKRTPFYLYVDEFQNFATSSFIKILSEARKYKLSLCLANQYIDQIDEDVLRAIFGNVGTLLNFNLGSRDSKIVAEEFGNNVEDGDLTSLDKYQIVMRESIDLTISKPFTGYSLPLPKNVSGHRKTIIQTSRQQYGLKLKKE